MSTERKCPYNVGLGCSTENRPLKPDEKREGMYICVEGPCMYVLEINRSKLVRDYLKSIDKRLEDIYQGIPSTEAVEEKLDGITDQLKSMQSETHIIADQW